MKIDEACIDHNVSLLAEQVMREAIDALNDNNQDNLCRVECIGEINGMIRLAYNLKEVLKQ